MLARKNSMLAMLLAATYATSIHAQNLFEVTSSSATSAVEATASPIAIGIGRTVNLAAKAGKVGKQAKFGYGVASGDPLATSVILWTHVDPPHSNAAVGLTWEVSTNEYFDDIVASGKVYATLSTDYTAKVDASGLEPGTEYWYRFKQGKNSSPIGRTRTLPDVGVEEVKFAVFSCANYPAGYFHAYQDAVMRGAKFALHLGDYIYESQSDGFGLEQSEAIVAMGRKSDPDAVIITLNDYRRRHAQYKSDPDSQLMHAAMPMIAIWDDHETAGGSYLGGAQSHDPNTEGTWSARVSAAIQAYHEWMPIRTGSIKEKIYRSFDFGDLISLHMIDSRLIGRDMQTDRSDPNVLATLMSPTRQLLGSEQSTWLQEKFANSPGKWQILGNQVLMSRMGIPVSILRYLGGGGVSPEDVAELLVEVEKYLTAKAKQAAGAPLSPAEMDLLNPMKNPKIGYNNDDWNGYPFARERVLNAAASAFAGRDRHFIVLAGDSHNSWYADVAASGYLASTGGLAAGTVVGQQIATPSVSSPGIEHWVPMIPEAQLNQLARSIIDDIKWMEASQRGWVMLTVTPSEVTAEWNFVSSVFEKEFTSTIAHSETITF